MALPSRDDLKAYLRIETSVDDDLVDRLLAQARASVEAYIRTPIESRAVTVDLYPQNLTAAGLGTRFVFPFAPLSATGVVLEDGDGATIDAGDYTVQAARGWITAASGITFDSVPHRITATVGLDQRDDYGVAVEPVMSAAILDWAADLYQRRNPAASYESGGGGVAVNYNETASKTMPSRIRVTLDPWRRVLV